MDEKETPAKVIAVAQISAMFPPGMSHTVVLELREGGAVTWREMKRG